MTDPTIPPPAPISTPTGPATTAEWRAVNENIGPVFKFAGLLLLIGDLVLVGLDLKNGKALGWPDVALHLGLALAALLLIRPPGFDNLVKTLADRLPFVNYQKPPS